MGDTVSPIKDSVSHGELVPEPLGLQVPPAPKPSFALPAPHLLIPKFTAGFTDARGFPARAALQDPSESLLWVSSSGQQLLGAEGLWIAHFVPLSLTPARLSAPGAVLAALEGFGNALSLQCVLWESCLGD